MKMLRHILRWMAYVTCLSLVGTGVFSYVRGQPRCTIAESFERLHDPRAARFVDDPNFDGNIVEVAADGSRIVTLQSKGGNKFGPLQVWDGHNGRLLREWHKESD